MRRNYTLALALVLGTLAAWGTAAELTGSWPQWRGPERTGISPEQGLLASWSESGPPLEWQVEGLGKGYASVAVSDDKIFAMGKRGGSEFLIALKREDGSELWAAEVGSGSHSNCTPTFDGELVYGVGLKGDLVAVNADSGEIVWRKNFASDLLTLF